MNQLKEKLEAAGVKSPSKRQLRKKGRTEHERPPEPLPAARQPGEKRTWKVQPPSTTHHEENADV